MHSRNCSSMHTLQTTHGCSYDAHRAQSKGFCLCHLCKNKKIISVIDGKRPKNAVADVQRAELINTRQEGIKI